MKMAYLWIILPIALSLYILSTLHTRIYTVNNSLMQASYIQLPGWSEVYYPEQKVDLSKWMGSNIKNLTIKIDDVRNQELEAAATLKALGIYGNDYTTKEVDGHWILYRPEKSEKIFTWQANYRVSRFSLP